MEHEGFVVSAMKRAMYLMCRSNQYVDIILTGELPDDYSIVCVAFDAPGASIGKLICMIHPGMTDSEVCEKIVTGLTMMR